MLYDKTMKTFLRSKVKNLKSSQAFTLIELLIVIAIIGVLSALLMTNFVGVRQRARDSQRKADLRQIQSALELYRADTGAYFIPGSGVTQLNTSACPTSSQFNSGTTIYMQKVPCDPYANSNTSYYNSGNYYYSSNGSTYTLAACLENSSDSDTNDTTTSPGGSGCPTDGNGKAHYFVLTNP